MGGARNSNLSRLMSSSAIPSRSILKALALYGGALLAALALGSIAQALDVEPPLPESAQPMTFTRACEAGDRLTIAAVGDVLPHESLALQAYQSPIGFQSLWTKVTPYIQQADIAYANLEGPAAAGVAQGGRLKVDPGPTLDRDVYTGTALMFNYHPRIISDLKASGFDVLSIANNHTLDRSTVGVDRTIEALIERGMPYSGAHRTDDPSAPLETVIERNGFRVAFIACTDVYNGRDAKRLITSCSGDFSRIASLIQRLNQDRSVDAVIVTPHWGVEYKHIATGGQRSLARKFLDAGASAVIGSHPHVLQEVESYVTKDGRETVIAYSLGNFVSWQGKVPGQKTTMLLFVGLTKRPGERAWVNGASYLPLWMDRNPNSINIAQLSKQASSSVVQNIVSKLMDPLRQLRPGTPLRTDLGCP